MVGWSWRTLIIIHRGEKELFSRERLFASGSKEKMDASLALITFPILYVITAHHTETERRRSVRLLLLPQEGGAASQPPSLLLKEQLVNCLIKDRTHTGQQSLKMETSMQNLRRLQVSLKKQQLQKLLFIPLSLLKRWDLWGGPGPTGSTLSLLL